MNMFVENIDYKFKCLIKTKTGGSKNEKSYNLWN